jgi:hypothetical protein
LLTLESHGVLTKLLSLRPQPEDLPASSSWRQVLQVPKSALLATLQTNMVRSHNETQPS